MCGLVGIARGNSLLISGEVGLFLQMLDAAKWRGMDSTGVVRLAEPSGKQIKKILSGKAEQDIQVRKGTVSSWAFIDDNNNRKFLVDGQKSALLGHTRKATVGAISANNAHPFVFPNVVGMMNGTIPRNHIANGMDYETDSEGVYAMINDMGPEAALAELTSSRVAPMALVYINKRLHTLEIFRNRADNGEDRPLCLALSSDHGTLLWASESYMIMWAVKARGYALSPTWKYATPKDKRIYRYPLLNNYDSWINDVEIVEVVPKPRPFVLAPVKTTPAGYVHGSKVLGTPSPVFPGATPPKYPMIEWIHYAPKTVEPSKTACDQQGTNTEALPSWPIARAEKYSQDTTTDPTAVSIAAAMARANDNDFDETSTPETSYEQFDPATGEFFPIDRHGNPLLGSVHEKPDEPHQTRRGPNGLYISRTVFDAYIKDGCCNCGDPIDDREKGVDHTIGWTSSGGMYLPICANCMNTDMPHIHVEDDARTDHAGSVN